MARRLEQRELPPGVSVMDSGTGGLDLAYEVMRGYHGLIIVDVSKQGEAPGTLYLIEPDEEEAGGAIEDGDVIDPHAMDPATVLRFVKAVGGWPGKVYVVAVEPVTVEEMGLKLSDEVGGRGGRRGGPRAQDGRGAAVHELSLSSAILDTVERHAAGRERVAREPDRGRAAPGGARLAGLLLRDRLARHGLRRRRAAPDADRGPRALRRVCARMGARPAPVPLPGVRGERAPGGRGGVHGRVDRGFRTEEVPA